MAVEKLVRSQLRIQFEDGLHPTSGEIVVKTKSFNNVVTNATADQLYTVGTALAALQQLPLYGIERFDNAEINAN
jgi:hypothetical protein